MSFLDDILGPIFGQKPDVPALEQLDLSEEQLKAIEANIKAAPEARKLADLTADEIDALIQRSVPNLDAIRGKVSTNIESYLKGEIPADVSDAVMRAGAAKAIAGGYGGTGMNRALVARDLGLTSLDLAFRGQGAAESWISASQQLYSPALATFQNMFITPTQQAAFSVEERNTQFQRSWLKNQIAAMPDPVMRGIHDTIMSLAVAYLGGNYQPQNAQQNYSAAGAGVGTGGYDGGWGGWSGGPGYGTPGYGPGGGNVPPPSMGGYDWEAIGGVGGAEAAMGGASNAGMASALGGGGLGAAMGAMCWVAREVYGEENPRWQLFRAWVILRAPRWFGRLYLQYGERFANWIKNKPRLKAIIRRWMDGRIGYVPIQPPTRD